MSDENVRSSEPMPGDKSVGTNADGIESTNGAPSGGATSWHVREMCDDCGSWFVYEIGQECPDRCSRCLWKWVNKQLEEEGYYQERHESMRYELEMVEEDRDDLRRELAGAQAKLKGQVALEHRLDTAHRALKIAGAHIKAARRAPRIDAASVAHLDADDVSVVHSALHGGRGKFVVSREPMTIRFVASTPDPACPFCRRDPES